MNSESEVSATTGVKPIFVLGLQRSGTTWLANIVCGSPDIACIESSEHQGIHESIFFSHFAQEYGNLADEENFTRFGREFSTCDYYLISGIEKDWLWHVPRREYPFIFRAFMEEVARRQGGRFWLEKSPHHTLLADYLASIYPDACFLCISRNPVDLIGSGLRMDGRMPPSYPGLFLRLINACARYSLYNRSLTKFASHCSASVLISYEALKEDPARVLERINGILHTHLDQSLLKNRYPPNTSFDSQAQKKHSMSRLDRMIILVSLLILEAVPLVLLRWLSLRRVRKRGVQWPDWCWVRQPLSPNDGGV